LIKEPSTLSKGRVLTRNDAPLHFASTFSVANAGVEYDVYLGNDETVSSSIEPDFDLYLPASTSKPKHIATQSYSIHSHLLVNKYISTEI
jgi:hypothetical protein